MVRQHVDHIDIARFAQEKVNLPKDKADEYRTQVRNLRNRLEDYLYEHPDFNLKKMLLSGSLAKGTALRSLNVGGGWCLGGVTHLKDVCQAPKHPIT